jgi:hypothetical protein
MEVEPLERRGICCAQYEVVDSNNVEGCCHGKLLFKAPDRTRNRGGLLACCHAGGARGDGIG